MNQSLYDPKTGLAIVNTEAPKTNAEQTAMWQSIAAAAAGMFNTGLGYLPKNRDANVAIAQANAEAERARAEAAKNQPKNNTTLYVAGGIVVLIIIILMMRK